MKQLVHNTILLRRRLQDAAQRKTASGAEPQPEPSVQEKHEAEICSLALAVLVRLTGNAGCVEALAEERALLLCYWLVHRPPGPPQLLLALRLLHALASSPPAAWAAAAQGGVVYLLALLLPADPPLPPFKVGQATQQSCGTCSLTHTYKLDHPHHAAPTNCLGNDSTALFLGFVQIVPLSNQGSVLIDLRIECFLLRCMLLCHMSSFDVCGNGP